MAGFRWVSALSYTKITNLSVSRFCLACVRLSIDGRYSHSHSQLLSSLAAHLTVCPLSQPCSTVTSGRQNVIATFVDEHTVTHYGVVHKPENIRKMKMFLFLVVMLVLISPRCTLAFSCAYAYACAYSCAYLKSVN